MTASPPPGHARAADATADGRRGPPEPFQVRADQASSPVSQQQGLEDSVAAGEQRIVDADDRVVRGDDLAGKGDDDLAGGRHGA
jgi:hypothetical protein